MTSWSILGHTAKVLEERRDDYGDPAEQFGEIAKQQTRFSPTPAARKLIKMTRAAPTGADPFPPPAGIAGACGHEPAGT